MIASATIVDLLGPKILVQKSFTRKVSTIDEINEVLEQFYELATTVSPDEIMSLNVRGVTWLLARLNETTLLVSKCIGDEFDEADLKGTKAIRTAMRWLIGESSVRARKDDFERLVERHFTRPLKFCVITNSSITSDNYSGQAVMQMVDRYDGSTPEPIVVGPYRVTIRHCTFDTFQWSEEFLDFDGLALVYSPDVDEGRFREIVETVRKHLSIPIMVVPSSDEELETARQFETMMEIDLCDSVSKEPTDLVLSMLATSMFIDVHPELAREIWVIDEKVDSLHADEAEPLGHQAFIVTDKRTGSAVYTYYYESKSKVLERAPNVIAAISMFRISSEGSADTSVFTTGNLNFIMIEQGDLVFTLVTGNRTDVEEMREKFSFLPDLWADESPENVEFVHDDLYHSPPFTLKLLATLPPENLLPRMVPYRVTEPEWDRFGSELVKDFLMAVWQSIDGKMDLGRLAFGRGPQMTLGAIHLLKRIGAVDFTIRLRPTDKFVLVRRPDHTERALYSDLDRVLSEVDGKQTLAEIAEKTRIQDNVLITVFTDLYRRGIISLSDDTTKKPS